MTIIRCNYWEVIKLVNMDLKKEHYEKMINLTPQLLCISDINGHFKYVNSLFGEILGYSTLEINELTLYDLIHQEDITLLDEIMKVIIDKRLNESSFEFRYRCKNGVYKWIAWNVRIQWDEQLIYSAGYDITERKVMENKQIATQQKLYKVLNNADAIITQIDKNGTIQLCEGRALKKIGLNPGNCVGKSIFELYKDNETILSSAKQALKGKKIHAEAIINGNIFNFNFSPIINDSGDYDGGIIIGTDITKMKMNEIELKRTTTSLKEAHEFAHLGYWEYDAITGYFPWSDEVFSIFGFKAQEFVPTMDIFMNMVHPDDVEHAINILNGPLESNNFEIDFKIRRHDNKTICTYQKVRCELDENRKPIKMYGIIQDITARKSGEVQLIESEEKYRSLANNIPAGILTYDINGNITFANSKTLELLGSPCEQVIRATNLFTIPILVENGISEVYKRCIESGKFIIEEKQTTSFWGKFFYERIQAMPIKDNKGNVVSAIAIIGDITDRKNLETDLHKAKEQADLSNKAKSKFLANMSHEIRTPMNGIMGMTDLLLLTELTCEQSEMAQIVKSSSKLLLNIINDILDLSKIDAGKVILNPEYVNIFSFVTSTYKLFKTMLQDKGLHFEFIIGTDVPKEVIIDKTRLAQIINNIIGNSIKFTDKGKIILSIKKIKIYDKVELMFSVSDTGIGIKEEDIPKLFNCFSQVEDSHTKRFQGTGLGLVISKGLVELMGGEMCVESEYTKGSTFYFTCLADIPKRVKIKV